MRLSIIAAAAVAAAATFGPLGSAQAQGVEIYVGPSAGYYNSYAYDAPAPAYGYWGYAPTIVTYPRWRSGCGDRYRRYDGNHCVDQRTLGSPQP